MSPYLVLGVLFAYFLLLFFISYLTSRKINNETFFNANKRSPWYLVAYGMIGASLSGITFISVPGWVKDNNFYYMQMVFGYLLGYAAIAFILLPIYYRLNLVSIYKFLEKRLGFYSYKTGAFFFFISRLIGAAFRLFLVVLVLQIAIFDKFKIPFALSIAITIIFIWLYTYRAGIKTIVWTDTLQTTFMILAVIIIIIAIAKNLNLDFSGIVSVVKNSQYSKMFDWNFNNSTFFVKQFLAGAFMAFVMTGLDQDMMQKNLTVKTLKESQKNMIWYSIALVPINLIFLSLGVLLFYYAQVNSIVLPEQTDKVFPFLALNYFGVGAALVFIIGVIAAAFSSADSALTALTTAFFIDFLNRNPSDNSLKNKKIKILVHIGLSLLLLVIVLIFKALNNESVIKQLFTFATYTYGPLLGLFIFGIATKRKIKDKLVPFVAVLMPVLAYVLKRFIEMKTDFNFGFEFIILNGFFVFLGLMLISEK